MVKIQGQRLIAELRKLAQFGRYKTGVHRPTYSIDDMAAREWLRVQLATSGLNATIDGIGNVVGRGRGKGPRLLLGSHLESQPHAGWLDGAMGVMYGLELVRAFAETPSCSGMQIDVGAWADEEGYFGTYLGSRSFCGEVSRKEIESAKSKIDGAPLTGILASAGLSGRDRLTMNPQDYIGYLEAHVEQGDYLEQNGVRLGIVTAIVGNHLYRITVTGEQNHAGTTRMAVRKDARVALTGLCSAIDLRFPEIARPRSVWNIGQISLDPGAPSVVPGKAEMLFQFRDAEPKQLNLMAETLRELVDQANRAGPCTVEIEMLGLVQPQVMSEEFQAALERCAEAAARDGHARLPSAAGHDAQVFARYLPAGMLFVPSIGGISHHYTEDTSENDIVLGCKVLADAAEEILQMHL